MRAIFVRERVRKKEKGRGKILVRERVVEEKKNHSGERACRERSDRMRRLGRLYVKKKWRKKFS